MKPSGRVPTTSPPARSRPTSSVASRSAAPTGPPSPSSMAPPGKAGWPACSRSSSLRWIKSRSGPSGPLPNRTSTADGLPPVAGGASSAGTSIVPAASASRSSHDGADPDTAGLGGTESGPADLDRAGSRSEEHTSELQSQSNLVCRLLLEKKKKQDKIYASDHNNTKSIYTSKTNPQHTLTLLTHNKATYVVDSDRILWSSHLNV